MCGSPSYRLSADRPIGAASSAAQRSAAQRWESVNSAKQTAAAAPARCGARGQVLVELGAEHANPGAFKEGGIQPLISLLWSENEAEQREVRGNMYVHVHVHKAYVDIYACVYVS